MKKLSSNTFGAIVICIIVFLFFLPNLLMGKVPIGADDLLGLYHPWRDQTYDGFNAGKFPVKNPLITDPVLQTYPWRYLAVNDIKEGNLPLWNPYSFSGQPLLANIQSSPFQLFNFLFFIFPFNIAWTLAIILPVILTGLFMFLFLRSLPAGKTGLQLSIMASMFGALVLPFTGFFIAWMTWGTIVTCAMWLPLILLAVNKLSRAESSRYCPKSLHERAEYTSKVSIRSSIHPWTKSTGHSASEYKLFTRQSPLWFIVLVVAASQTILSGHWQTAFYVFIATFFYVIFQTFQSKKLEILTIIVCGLALGILISAVQLLPALEFVRLSAREIDQGYFTGRTDWFLPVQNLIQLVAPDFFGNPATYNYWGIWNWAEFVSFSGIIPFTFAIFAFLSGGKRTIFFTFLAIFSLVFAIANPISKIPYIFNFPLISSMQPSRILFLFIFSLSVLSAYGVNYFIEKKREKKHIIPAVLILSVLFVLAAYTLIFKDVFPITGNIDSFKVALRNLIFPILISFSMLALIILKIAKIPKTILLLAIFALTLFELFRFGYKFTPFSKLSWIFPQTQTTKYLSSQEKPFRIMTTDRRIFNGNTPSVYQIEAVNGYDPLYLKDYAMLVTAWESQKVTQAGSFNRIVTPQKYFSKIADFLNVRYIATFDELSEPGFEKVFQEGETKIFRNDNALPRAFFVKEVIRVGDQNQELEQLLDPHFDIRSTAVSSDFGFPKQRIEASVNFIKYSDQSLTLRTKTDDEAPLVISNVFYPGWQVYIDGQKDEIKRINYMFQSVLIPRGEHEAEFKFRPQSFYNGLYLSIVGIIITIFFSLYLWHKKYQ